MLERQLCRVLAGVCLAGGLAVAGDVPRPSPDFAVKLVDGKQILVSQYKGEVRIVAFILTYCSHCQQTVCVLSKMQNEFGQQGLQVIASAIEGDAALHVPDFIRRFRPPFPVGFNAHEAMLAYLQHPAGVKLFMPQLVFVDRKGIIRAQYKGEDKFIEDNLEKNMRDQIGSLLKGPAPSKKPAPAHKKAV